MTQKPVVVIGAGMVGISTAIWLLRAGRRVILIDKGKPGSGASFGNAGLIAQWAVAPVSSPSLWKDAPRMLLKRDEPLFLKWRQLPWLLPWLTRFMSNATDAATRRIVSDIAPLLSDAKDQHRSLVAGTEVESWIVDSKLSYAYHSRAGFEKDAYSWAFKRQHGFAPVLIEGPDVREAEPILSERFQCLAVIEGQGHITNPAAYIAALARQFVLDGGEILEAQVKGFAKTGGRISQLRLSTGTIDCSHAVITAGAWSKELMQQLGLNVPLVSERGYHVVYESPSEMPRNPMMHVPGKFGVNPMETGLRCAGTVELGDHRQGPSRAPLSLIRKRVAEDFPKLTYAGTQEWMGFRPSTPDSLPLIGELGQTGIFVGFGHQHVGLTAGPKTGRLLAQLIAGAGVNMDLSAYDPARF